MSTEHEPSRLAHALQRELKRREARGQRRVVRVAPLAPAAGSRPAESPPAARPAASAVGSPEVTHNETQTAPERPPAARTPNGASPGRATPSRPPGRPEPAPASGSAPPAPAVEGDPPAEIAAGIQTLEELRACVADCRACALAESRTQTVFADGEGTRRILFVGEAPGADEDRTGTPFVGRAGQLLTDIIVKGMKLRREDVYIANVLKCRPPGNRDPLPSETALCTGWLDRQIELVDPLVIIPLGRHAACHVLGVDAPLGRLRAKVHEKNGRKVVPTYHPAYLLRSPHEKKKTWEDIQLAMREAGL